MAFIGGWIPFGFWERTQCEVQVHVPALVPGLMEMTRTEKGGGQKQGKQQVCLIESNYTILKTEKEMTK
jgi:hypothetical protein